MSASVDALQAAWPRGVMAAVVAFVVAEAWRRFALRRGVLDIPGHRSSHEVPTPRGAGIAIALALALAVGLWAPPGTTGLAVLVGLVAVALVGLVDDLRPLPASWKFLGQAVAAVPVAIALPLAPVFLPFELPQPLAVAASAALVLLFVNAWNFMDGIDGIATSAAMAVAFCALIAVWGAPETLVHVLALAVFSACAGFLPINLPKARAFMGDCGSHALGMAVAVLVLSGSPAAAGDVARVASAAFLVDVLGTLGLRAIDGERLASAHRRHLYQLVTRNGYSHGRVTMAYGVWMLASGGGMAMALTAGFGGTFAAASITLTAGTWWWAQRHFTSRLKERGQW